MEHIGAFEAKTHWSSLLEKVRMGAEIIITKRGVPVARLVPEFHDDKNKMDMLISDLKALRSNAKLGKTNWKTLRDEGRL